MSVSFIILGAGKPHVGEQHVSLNYADGTTRVLDWVLGEIQSATSETIFVAGYEADKVQSAYGQLKYIFNEDWSRTGSAWSLVLALRDICGAVIAGYSDILFREELIAKLIQDEDVVISVDCSWKTRFAGRPEADLLTSEKVRVSGPVATLLGKTVEAKVANSEFVGLCYLSEKAVNWIKDLSSDPAELEFISNASVADLIERLRLDGFNICAADAKGQWAEYKNPADIARFVLGTKAKTLHRLRSRVRRSIIEEQVSFTVALWRNDKESIVKTISAMSDRVVVRSSALNEDGFIQSNAGAFKSILDVNSTKSEEIINAVDEVINSYGSQSEHNEVLVQPMLGDVMLSGVVFTRTLENSAPYYTVNYDDISGSTDSITSGTSNVHKTYIVRRDLDVCESQLPLEVKKILASAIEIENILNYDSLDMEFAISHRGIHVLQVRPLLVSETTKSIEDQSVFKALDSGLKDFRQLSKLKGNLVGDKAIYGNMPDWNPAEIIGTKPSPLSSSLYRYLLMDDNWAIQRAEFGYRNVEPVPLMRFFCGQPYIDVRASLNSFIPVKLPDAVAEKLVNRAVEWLSNNPTAHDKIEFEVLPSCYVFDFDKWKNRFQIEGCLTPEEFDMWYQELTEITRNSLGAVQPQIDKLKILNCNFDRIVDSDLPDLQKAFFLLEDAKKFGALPFAHLARLGFVAISILKSAVNAGVISESNLFNIMASMRTVSHELTDDCKKCSSGELEFDDLIAKYGHLRPGTYDVLSSAYREDPDQFLRPLLRSDENIVADAHLSDESLSIEKIGLGLKDAGIEISVKDLLTFLKESIEGREYAKFCFTKNLSSALELFIKAGSEIGISRHQLSKINIGILKDYTLGQIELEQLKAWITVAEQKNQGTNDARSSLLLPGLITEEADFNYFSISPSEPNFIGSDQGELIGKRVEIKLGQVPDIPEGSIVFIPQADPGYDWLFGHKIGGLITMYGGANSHMAIRAAEYSLPAAIGIGEARYKELSRFDRIVLNPGQRVLQGAP